MKHQVIVFIADSNNSLVSALGKFKTTFGLSSKTPKDELTSLQRQVDALELPDSKSSNKESPVMSAHLVSVFSDGREVHYVAYFHQLGAFERHSFLRKSLGGLLKRQGPRQETVEITLLSDLPKSRVTQSTELCAHDLSLLHGLQGFQPKSFGNRGTEDKKKREKQKRLQLVFKNHPSSLLREAEIVASAMNEVRTLAMLPHNELDVPKYVHYIKSRAKATGQSFEFIDAKRLRSLRAGAFLAVIQGSPDSRGGIVHLQHRPKKTAKKRVVLVGKGLCFDTGGYNLKPGQYMRGMHGDMTGSAVALALSALLVELHPEWEVHTYLAIAENFINEKAYKTDDVVIASDGTSIEVVDTDAEGRMVLADTLVMARKAKGDIVLDFATLTGTAVRAIGTQRGAVFSHTPSLLELAIPAGDRAGERVWTFPVGGDYKDLLKSEVADLLQCAPGAAPDHILAATFLSHFIGKETPWLHVDLSASEHKGGLGLVSTEVTGFGTRFALEVIRSALR